jgi:transcriptional regulator with XRE-family HTH domain
MTENFRAITARLRSERGMTMEDLAFEARRHAPSGVSLSLIQKRLAPGSDIQPSAELLAALAGAFGVEPDVYPEYRLAVARRALDEREVGLDDALETLTVFEAALREGPTRRARRARERALDTQRQKQQGPRGRATRRAT